MLLVFGVAIRATPPIDARNGRTMDGKSIAAPANVAAGESRLSSSGTDRDHTELGDYVAYRLTVLAGLITREGAKHIAKRFGISLPEWRVLRMLSVAPDTTVSYIAEASQLDKGLISRSVTSLTERGYVARSDRPGDRRSFTVRLTRRGRALHDRILPISQARQRRLIGCLTERERKTFYRALDKIEALVRTQGSFTGDV
jgi:DNA-binding MarR family transcriptional regulator